MLFIQLGSQTHMHAYTRTESRHLSLHTLKCCRDVPNFEQVFPGAIELRQVGSHACPTTTDWRAFPTPVRHTAGCLESKAEVYRNALYNSDRTD
jgi:hypothetical protein